MANNNLCGQPFLHPQTISNQISSVCCYLNTSLAAQGALAHRLQRRTACNAAPRASGPQNGQRGLERCLPLGFGALPSTFAK